MERYHKTRGTRWGRDGVASKHQHTAHHQKQATNGMKRIATLPFTAFLCLSLPFTVALLLKLCESSAPPKANRP